MDNNVVLGYSGKSVAVLPFVNISADPENEYFSDGITEEITNALTKIQGLRVIARTSAFAFKGKNIDVRTIGKQLGVTTVLEGSVRKVKNRVRITTQLVSTSDGSHLWAKNFDREMRDVFFMQDEISLLIADQIRENFGHLEIRDHLVDAPTQNIEAYNLYLKGRYHHLKWNARDLIQGVEYYRSSIQQDPSFALPYFSAGLCCGINAAWGFIPYDDGMQQAEQFLQRGFSLDNQSHIGCFAQGTVGLWGKWDFKMGHDFLMQSIAINPSFTEAEEGLAELYTAIGAFEKAMSHTSHILTLNPLSPNHYYTRANIMYLSGNYEDAIKNLESALQIDPHFALAIEKLAVCYIHLGDYEKLDQFLRSNPQAEKPNECRALYKLVNSAEGIEIDLEAIRLNLSEENPASLIPWHLYLHVHLGNHELALDLLEEGIKVRTGQLINFKNDPFLTPLQVYPRFRNLVASLFDSSLLPSTETNSAVQSRPVKWAITKVEASRYLSAISDLLENEHIFLDQSLCLKLLAEKVDLHANRLSWLLNEHIGKNFNEYINSFRLEAFKRKALDPANSHLTLLGLAYESGFNSKTVFNAFFKKMEGMTPRDWVKLQK